MRSTKRALTGLCVLLTAVGWMGCEGASTPPPPRLPQADPVAAQYLVGAQDAFRRASFDVALALADSAGHRSRPDDEAFLADVHFLKARIQAELNRPEQARVAYERVLSLQPGYRGVWLNMGNDAFRRAQYSEALAHYRREQQQHPDPRQLVYIGRTYAELGQTDSARYAYEQAIEVDDSLAEAHVRLGQLYESIGETAKALPHAQRALELEPDDPGYRYLVGLLHLQAGQAEEALTHLETVVEQRPYDHEGHYNLARALGLLGRQGEADVHLVAADSLRALDAELNEWKTLTRLHPERPAVWATYAYALRRAGRPGEALRAFKTALYLDPANPEVRFEVANQHLLQGQLSDAIVQYEAVLQQDSTLVDAWINAGIALARIGQMEAARRAWEAALRHAPDHPQARAYLKEARSTSQNGS